MLAASPYLIQIQQTHNHVKRPLLQKQHHMVHINSSKSKYLIFLHYVVHIGTLSMIFKYALNLHKRIRKMQHKQVLILKEIVSTNVCDNSYVLHPSIFVQFMLINATQNQ